MTMSYILRGCLKQLWIRLSKHENKSKCQFRTNLRHLLRGRSTAWKKAFVKVGIFVVLILTVYRVVYGNSSVVDKFDPAFILLKKIGNSHIDYFEEFAGITEEEKIVLMKRMRDSVMSLKQKCALSRKMICRSSQYQRRILTLFTTWVYDKEKFYINNRTLYNWRALPNVTLVVFTNSTEVKKFSELAGFHVLPVTKEVSGVPVLPVMFDAVMTKFQSEFYGYANGDILFTNTLVETLKQVHCHISSNARQKRVLIVGRRTNIPAALITNEIASSWDQLDRLLQIGTLFQSNAEDYFITDRHYPWKKFTPVVVGRRAYDNWVVAYSRYNNVTVIDATESIQCLHQTLANRGNYEGLHKGDYNVNLIKELKLPFTLYNWGRTSCAEMKSWTNLCGEIVLSGRYRKDSMCSSFQTLLQVYKLFGLVK